MKKLLLLSCLLLCGCETTGESTVKPYLKYDFINHNLLINKETGETWILKFYSNLEEPVWKPVGFESGWDVSGKATFSTNEKDEKKRTSFKVTRNPEVN